MILGRPTLNKIGAVISTTCLTMKFFTDKGEIIAVKADQVTARRCYNASLEIQRQQKEVSQGNVRPPNASKVMMVDLDTRKVEGGRLEPDGKLEKIQIGKESEQTTQINKNLPTTMKQDLVTFLKSNADLFVWTAAHMPGISPKFMSHRLPIFPNSKPVAQKRRRMSPDRALAVQGQVQSLLEAGFIREVVYPTSLSNIVMVKKSNGKWRMYVDYTHLNKACPKDLYPLPSIDGLVDAASDFRLLTFTDAYSGYNQILMCHIDEEKTGFITPTANYCYKVMPFDLKNMGATYQRLMNKVFTELIGDLMEVYIDDMLIKTREEGSLLSDLEVVFSCLRQHNMRLNLHKCAFVVEARKFL